MRVVKIPANSGRRGRDQDALDERVKAVLAQQARCCNGLCKRAAEARSLAQDMYQIENAGYPTRS